jgi:hypothetical protein
MESDPSNTDVVKGPNHPPVAYAQSVTTNEDTSAAITLTGSDVDGDGLRSWTVITPPAHGTLSGTAPNLTYTPHTNYSGPDSFTFTVFDGTATSAVASVSIEVTAVNDAPVATTGLSVTAAEDTPTAITLNGSDADGNPLTFAVTTLPTHGTLSGIPPNLTYTPALNYNGTDGLAFTVSDGMATSAAAPVTITVTTVNDAPVAADESYSVLQGSALSVAAPGVLANDTDVDSSSLTAVIVTPPSSGALTLNSNGSFTYTPNPGFKGSDSFTYRASDGSLGSNAATVSIAVNAAYALVGLQNVPPAASTVKAKAGSSVPMTWQFKDGSTVVNSAAVLNQVTIASTSFSNTDSGSSAFRYDALTGTWSFNLQTKSSTGVPYPTGTYTVTITPAPSGYLPSQQPFTLVLSK